MQRWHDYWFSPWPCLDLAVTRIVMVGTQLFWITVFTDMHQLLVKRAALDDGLWQPLPIMNLLNLPFGWGLRPGVEVIEIMFAVSLLAGVFSLIGLLTNASLVVFAATSVYLQAFAYSFGDFHHPEAVMMVALSVLALSPCGRVLSVDGWLRARKRPGPAPDVATVTSDFAVWPLRLLQWFFAFMYISAVFNKLSFAGIEWANGYTLQYVLARDGLRWGSDLGVWLSQFHTLVLVGQIGVLVFQATFVLAVIFPILRWVYVPAGLAFHTLIYLTLAAPFFSWIALYVVFIPWASALQHLRAWRSQPSSAQAPA